MTLALHARAKRPQPVRFHEIASRIAARFSPQVADAFLDAILTFQSQIDEIALLQAVAGADFNVIEAAVASGGDLATIIDNTNMDVLLRRTAGTSGTASAAVLSDALGVEVSFNALHPNVVMFARTQTANLVVNVGNDVREAIRIVLTVAQQQGLTVVQQAKAIQQIVGLPPNWAQAPLNLANELRAGQFTTTRRLSKTDKKAITSRLAKGKPLDPEFIAKMQAKYTESLIERRALNIARTETLRASHNGQRESWKQARQDRVLPETVRRIWIATLDARVRPEHAAIPGMNPGGVPLDGVFQTPDGPVVGPPLDVNCRCGESLVFP